MKLLSVNFHYIRDDIYENGIYPRSLKQLSSQIDVLSKYYTFISQEELSYKIKNKIFDTKNYCLLTFDDGLKEQMDAFDLLSAKGVPAIFYVTTHSIRNAGVVDVHKLHYIRSCISDSEIYAFIEKNIDLSDISFPKNINELYRYDTMETKKLKYLLNFILVPKVKTKLIDKILISLIDTKKLSQKLYMNIDDIKRLDSKGSLGTHSDLHLPLATLSQSEIIEDIENSMSFLRETCGAKGIKSISYPFGGPKAVSQDVANISYDFGFDFGLTMFRGINEIQDLENPLLLKRVDTNDAPGGKLGSTEFCL